MFAFRFLLPTLFLLLLPILSLGQSGTTDSVIYWFYDGEGGYHPGIVNHETSTRFFFWNESHDKEKDVHFLLYTRGHPTSEELIIGDIDGLNKSKYDRRIPTKIIIHGFTNSDNIGFPPAAKQTFLQNNNSPLVNLIIVDWGKLAQAPWYSDAARNTKLVGVKVARFIKFLVAQGSLLDQIHLIGHSLGSHIAGFAGSHSHLNNMTLSRITALDPALPHFQDASDENRIDRTDAAYVDVIHTAGGESSRVQKAVTTGDNLDESVKALAFIEPRGHADFYVNGGRWQPGCGMDFFGACSHIRAYEYYLESVVNPKGFLSCECESWEDYKNGDCSNCASSDYMGEQSSSSAKGNFFLRTKSKRPYAIGDSSIFSSGAK